jgi:hypothetical protein
MSLNRFTLGFALTVIWLCVMFTVAAGNWQAASAMKPNEWGDFFAGFFAPLAFLWLVLGYLQQGDELQLSTKALLLQAEELRNSVEQQRELVEVTRQQLDGEREARQLGRAARQEAAKPLFVVVNGGGSFCGNAACSYNIEIFNEGNTVTQVEGMLSADGIPVVKLLEIQMFSRSSKSSVYLSLTAPFPEAPGNLTIAYLDSYGQPGNCFFSVARQHATYNSSLMFTPITGESRAL